MDERRRVHELDRDGGAQHRVVVARRRARPRRTPAAAAAACRPPRSSPRRARPAPSPCERASACSRASRRSISSGTCAPPASMTAATASALAISGPPCPACRAMIPPAVRIQRTSRSPARASTPPSASRAREALHRARQVRVGLRLAASLPSSGTTRSNQSEKNVDSGGRCGVVISSTTTRPPGRTTRAISPSPRSRSEKLRAPKPTVAASNAPSS